MRRSVRLAAWLCSAALLAWLAVPPASAQPDSSDIIQKLALPKPGAGDLTGPARGIRAAAPEAAPAIDLAIPFQTGSATLAPQSTTVISALGKALASPDLSGDHFKIEGHADTVGVAAANLSLSQRRAETVAAVLTQTYGVPASRLTAVGVGSDQLVVPTPDQTAEPRNRVVRVINLGPAEK